MFAMPVILLEELSGVEARKDRRNYRSFHASRVLFLKMEQIQALFFDIGDTLVFDHPSQRERFAAAACRIGLPIDPSRLARAWQKAEQTALQFYLQGIAFDNPGVMRAAAQAALSEGADIALLPDRDWQRLLEAFIGISYTRKAHPQAAEMLGMLRERGFPLGVISDWETDLPDVLGELGLLPFFSTITTSQAAGVTKPNARLFRAALSSAGVPAQNALHIGDWKELDIDGARGAGMHALLFDHAVRAPAADCPRVATFAALADALVSLPAL